MSTDNTNTKRVVLLLLSSLALFVLGSIVISFNYIDLLYLCLIFVYMFRYLKIKKDV